MTTPIVHADRPKPAALDYSPPGKKVWLTRIIGLFGGLVLATLVYFLMPDDAAKIVEAGIKIEALKKMNLAGMPIVAAVAVLMAVWWMSEAIPLPATALVPMVAFPIFAVDTFKGTAAPYADPTIYLFMGGFILALAMQRWNLHRRIALSVVAAVGTRPRQLVAGFMIATGFLSMWVSNTATAVMMLPIGLSVLQLVGQLTGTTDETPEEIAEETEEIAEVALDAAKGGVVAAVITKGKDTVEVIKERAGLHHSNFAVSLMLGIAYAASIGSLGTIIGTPPNALMVAYLKSTHNIDVGFGQWMIVGVPLATTFLAIGWWLLTYVLFKPEISEIPGGKDLIRAELKKMGPMTRGELLVAIHFLAAALLWVFLPPILSKFGIEISGLDTIVAMGIALLLFLVPADPIRGVRLMNWEAAKELPWDILLLFGGGLALSAQFSRTGLSQWIGIQVKELRFLPVIILLVLITLLVIFLTEMTSNTATAAAFLPILGGVALGLGYEGNNVMLFVVPVALAATCAFMLPVATPPNAIAYGSGFVRMSDMIRAGIWLNLIGTVLITATVVFLAVPVFGLSLTP